VLLYTKANHILSLLRRSMYGCSKEVKKRPYVALVRPHLEYCLPVWNPHLKKDCDKLESAEKPTTKIFLQQKFQIYCSKRKHLLVAWIFCNCQSSEDCTFTLVFSWLRRKGGKESGGEREREQVTKSFLNENKRI